MNSLITYISRSAFNMFKDIDYFNVKSLYICLYLVIYELICVEGYRLFLFKKFIYIDVYIIYTDKLSLQIYIF